MTMTRGPFALASALTFVFAAVVASACDSGDDEQPMPAPADTGDAGLSEAGVTDAGTRDTSTDAPEELVDASAEPITCAVTPCAVEIAAGAESVCVRLNDGVVSCWGSNAAGALGRGPDASSPSSAPAPVVGLRDATQISGSASVPGDTYCALRAGGAAVCWGSNANGVLGRVDDEGAVITDSSPVPGPVAGIHTASAVAAGYFVSCALLAGNDVACWGSNDAAQLPSSPHRPGIPLPATTFPLGSSPKQLGVADRGTVALTDTGLVSWGLQGDPLGPNTGVLGREASTATAAPAKIELAHVSAIAASKGRVCAIANGRVYCWGAGPTAGSDSVYPAYVGVGGPIAHAQTVAVGPRSACATLSDGSAWCWGDNSRGQLGVGNADLQPIPVRVQKLAGRPVRMAVMEATTCAILSSGAVQCWGQNDNGQLGTGAADALPYLDPQNVVLTP